MDAAKNAVKNIISRGGHHDTTVDESVNPAVTSETVKPHRHEETTQAVDREVHQDHYHTTVQPLQHKEVLPEKHTHQAMPVQEREVHHGDSEGIRSNVEAEAAKFQSTSRVMPTTESTAQAATATGEHVHHHVHETVQPVIHKETVQPEVVHTTIPIHETHHAQAEHHGMSTLPTKTLAEFKELGGAITGSTHRHEEYEGHPRPYNPELQSSRGAADLNPEAHDGLHGSHTSHHTGTGTTGTTGTTGGVASGLTGTTGTHHTHGTHGTGTTGGVASGLTGTTGTHHTHGTHGTGTNVSGVGNTGSDYNTGSGYTSGGVGSTGTALGGRSEGNTAGRALEAAAGHGHGQTGHSTVGHTSTSGTTGTSGIGSGTSRGIDDSTTGYSSTGGTGTHHGTGHTDTSSSDTANTGNTGSLRDDVQSPRQGKDPNLVEASTSGGSGLKGEGVPGSHSAVFGLTPDGQKYDDTKHSSTSLKPAHSSKLGESTSSDAGSRAPTGQAISQQLNDPRVNERGVAGSGSNASSGLPSTTGSGKPGAGTSTGPSQGFGEVRASEHGSSAKMTDKLDPTTDADGDGKRGVMD